MENEKKFIGENTQIDKLEYIGIGGDKRMHFEPSLKYPLLTNMFNVSEEMFLKNICKKPTGNYFRSIIIEMFEINDIIKSMDLDEMLEAYRIAEMFLQGEKNQVIMSSKAKRYVDIVLKMNEEETSKFFVEGIQCTLALIIVEENIKTADEEEGKRLYRELMQEE